MERTEVLDMMSGLKHEPQRFVGDLLKAEISEKQARSIKYQLTVAKLPLAKDVDDFAFKDTPINEALVRDLARGGFIAQQRNVVLVGGTGTGKTHLTIAIVFTTVDLANQLEAEGRAGRQGRIADYLTRLDFVILDELGYLPFAQAGGQLLFHLVSRLYERNLNRPDHRPRFRRVAERVRRSKDDDRAPRSTHPPLRYR
jgi:DNA replication protein DnaC